MVCVNRAQKIFAPAAAVTVLAVAALGLPAGGALAVGGHPLPLWKVSDGHGHHLYLVGSMHVLTKADYPLPEAFAAAFAKSDRLVEEINLTKVSPLKMRTALREIAMLPKGKTLADAMGQQWEKTQKLARKAGIDLSRYKHYKPWLAAMRISMKRFIKAGYLPLLGLDFYFARQAQKRGMPIEGLETVREQLGFFRAFKPATQRAFLLKTLEQLPKFKQSAKKLHAAWRTGNLEKLNAMANRDFAGYPALRRALIYRRNRNWMPSLRRCLESGKTCFVVVGAAHMAGEKGLVALFEKAGYRVAQLTTELAPPASGTAASPAAGGG